MTKNELKELALYAAKKQAPANYSVENVDAAVRDGFAELCSSYNDFQRNKYDIFDIIIQVADDVVPKKVIDRVGIFAEVQQVPQGQKALFKRKLGKNRARQFLTQVGLSGVYETFRLDSATFEVGAHAVGGAATVDFERVLDGAENMADVMEIVTEGLTDAAFYEIQKTLKAGTDARGNASPNKVSTNGFQANQMVNLINIAKTYGGSAAIFAPPEFVTAMGPDAIVPAIANAAQAIYHPDDIDKIHFEGRIKIFRGTPIVEMDQSFIDETNSTTWLDPQYAFVLPTGGEKVVKLVFEGQTQIRDFTNNGDNSMEFHAYKKLGSAILTNYNWGIYQNTGIPATFANPYGFD